MTSDFPLRDRFWRDVAIAAGPRDLDPRTIRFAVEDMMHNYHLDEVPGFETASQVDASNVPDTNNFSHHSPFSPVFSRTIRNALSSFGCFNTARPIFVGPRGRVLRRRKSCPEPRPPDHAPADANPGIQADTGNALDPHIVPFVDIPPPAPGQPLAPALPVNGVSPWHHPPHLPPWSPHHYVWAFPTGHLAWSPHPQLNAYTPHPPTPWAALPGTMPQWTPGTWPPLDWARDVPIRLSPHTIPNPNNAHLPLIDWNVTKHPSTAKRLTSNHVVVDMTTIWGDTVTHTKAQKIVVACDVGYMSTLWGPIVMDQSAPVTLRDLFEAIYAYFQVPLTYPEVQYILDLHPGNYRRMADAYYERCRESVALPGWEAMQGFRRADVLGDRKHWWGVWISSRHGTWWLNLGLVNPSHRRRSR